MRLPAGESALTRLKRVKDLLEVYRGGGQPSRLVIMRALGEYHDLLRALWLWGVTKPKV
ncbi:hypothetical protein ES703_22460 [subsurface metagenome]